MRVLDRLTGTRIVSTPAAIGSTVWPEGAMVFRLAADEVFVTGEVDASAIADPHAIVVRETGFSGVRLERVDAIDFLERECDWELPTTSEVAGFGPRLEQGLVAGLPVKVWFERDHVFFFIASPLATDFMERLR